MKRLFFCFLVLFSCVLSAQVNYDDYFTSQTLAVYYTHTGDKNDDTYSINRYRQHGEWAKSRKSLVDEFEYGNQKVELQDPRTGKTLYSYTYNTLFGEYRMTPEGENQPKEFQECVLLPMPMEDVRVIFYTRQQGRSYEQKFETIFSPQQQRISPLRQRYATLDLHVVAPAAEAYDLLIVPEGYAEADSVKLRKDVARASQAILGCEPFSENAQRINIRALCCYSKESGISKENSKDSVRHTVLGTSFYTFGTERYLMLEDVWQLHTLCAQVPYEHILILCNTQKYGGGGIYNWYSTVSDNKYFDYVCVHELGHGIAGLADEYYTSEVAVQDFYPEGVEPVEPNITNLVDFSRKWLDMLDPRTKIPTKLTEKTAETLGVYEGAGYCAKGLYRPWKDCTMKEIKYNHFCPVCKRAFNRMFDFCCDKL